MISLSDASDARSPRCVSATAPRGDEIHENHDQFNFQMTRPLNLRGEFIIFRFSPGARSFLTFGDKAPDESHLEMWKLTKNRFARCLATFTIINVNWWTVEWTEKKSSHEISILKTKQREFHQRVLKYLVGEKFTYYWKKSRKFRVEISFVSLDFGGFSTSPSANCASLNRNPCKGCVTSRVLHSRAKRVCCRMNICRIKWICQLAPILAHKKPKKEQQTRRSTKSHIQSHGWLWLRPSPKAELENTVSGGKPESFW